MMTLLALLPIISMLVCLLVLKFSVARSGAISLGITLVIAIGFFGLPIVDGLPWSISKALWLALFVSLIVWLAIFLYHLVDDFKAFEVINKNLSRLVDDKFVAFLLLAWMFTGLLQGMAGFGVPAVIVTPILIALGYDKVKSLAGALLGHSWAVTFGSLGAAFFVIQGITLVPYAELAWYMFIFGTAAHFLTGIGVSFIYDGFKGVRKGFLYVLPVSLVMTGVQFLMISINAYPLAGLVPALVGLITLFGLYKLRSMGKAKAEGGLYRGEKLNLLQAALPYLVIIVLALSFQLVPQSVNDAASFGPNIPAFATPLDEGPLNFGNFEATIGEVDADNRAAIVTALGDTTLVEGNRYHYVRAETNYNPIRVFRHPAMLLLSAAITALIVYKSVGILNKATFKGAVQKTVKKGIPATLALLALGNMSLIMMDSGMTLQLAQTTANITGQIYPLFAPFIGVLGSFLTGNNTNANVLFGAFQYNIAYAAGFTRAAMTAVQSMTAGVAVSIGPTLILMGALASDQKGVEPTILKKLLPIVLLIALIIGGINMIVMNTDWLSRIPEYYNG